MTAIKLDENLGSRLLASARAAGFDAENVRTQNLNGASEFLRVSPRDLGVTYDTGERFPQLREQFPRTIANYQSALDFAVSHLGPLGVKELEPLTTSLFVTQQQPNVEASARAAKLMQIKPHVKTDPLPSSERAPPIPLPPIRC